MAAATENVNPNMLGVMVRDGGVSVSGRLAKPTVTLPPMSPTRLVVFALIGCAP